MKSQLPIKILFLCEDDVELMLSISVLFLNWSFHG